MRRNSKKKYVYVYLFLLLVLAYFTYDMVFANVDKQISKVVNLEEKKEANIEIKMDSGMWVALTERLKSLSDSYKADVGIYVKDLRTNRVWEYNSDRLFRSASLIKFPIMIAVMNKVEKKEISFDDKLEIRDKNRVAGGSLMWAKNGTKLSLLEVIYRMITESDNTATKLLIDHFGIEYFESSFRQMGLAYTNITPEGMSLTSGRVGRENYTTPREMAYLLEKIYRKEMVSKSMSEMMMDILKRNKSSSRLRKGIPLSWEVGHKTGLLRKSCSDVGIVFSPNGDYILAVLIDNVPTYRSGKNFISNIAKITSEYYKNTN
ncbi:MAG: serine hydrolase [Elusimicrobia bacterium]|nr:serine hydrolase [Elusimicrobiota bacterium]